MALPTSNDFISTSEPGSTTDLDVKDAGTSPEDAFTKLWEEALRHLQLNSGLTDTQWKSYLERLDGCNDADQVCAFLNETQKLFDRFRSNESTWGKLGNKLKPVAEVLLLFNDTIAETAAYFPAVPGGKAIFVAFRVLLEATKGVSAYCEALISLFDEFNTFFDGLRVRLADPASLGPVSRTIVITILAHLVNVCLRATKLLSKRPWLGRLALYWKAIKKDTDMQNALQRLRELAAVELKAIAIETRVAVSATHVLTADTRALVSEVVGMVSSLSSDLAAMRKKDEAAASRAVFGRGFDKLLKGQRDMATSLESERRRNERVVNHGALEKLGPVMRAHIDKQQPTGCMRGTRVKILKDLRAWSLDPFAPRLFWLNGMAGTGKSAIARSFCHNLMHENLLGGSFFCSRGGSVDEGDVQRIIPTLAYSLALHKPDFHAALLPLIDGQPTTIQWNLELQIVRLLPGPFARIVAQGTAGPMPVVVIDALDECADGRATRDLLLRLVTISKDLPIKFFLTSRPEPHIRDLLEQCFLNAALNAVDAGLSLENSLNTPALGQILRLHDIEQDLVRADISLYLTAGLRDMRKPSFPAKWPSKSDVNRLTSLSGKLFIYAFTALEYVRKDPIVRLQKLIRVRIDLAKRLAKITSILLFSGRPMTKPLDAIYDLILSEAMDENENDEDEISLTRHIIAIIVTIREPLSVISLGELLGMPADRIRRSLDHLYAVIYVPICDDSGVLSMFHASFGDYLTTEERAPLYMHEPVSDGHKVLASSCMKMLASSKLSFNVTQATTSFLSNTDQNLTLVDGSLRYACLHWSHHVTAIRDEQILSSVSQIFIGPKFLFWLEVLSAAGVSENASEMLEDILSLLPASSQLHKFFLDAIFFIKVFKIVIAQSVPHIYLSALSHCDQDSLIGYHCLPYFSNLASSSSAIPVDPAHSQPRSVAYSPNGSHIAAGFMDGTIRVWDAHSAKEYATPLMGHADRVQSIAFSHDGTYIVSGSFDETIYIWDIQTGEPTLGPILGHTDEIHAVVFSPGSDYIASGSSDKTIIIWDAKTGDTRRRLRGHKGRVWSIAYSPDGLHLASGSEDGTVHIWNTKTCHPMRSPLSAQTGEVSSIAFLPDGLHIVAGSADNSVTIWDIGSGHMTATLTGHEMWVRSVACSLTGNMLASGSMDGNIKIWDVRSNELALPTFTVSGSVFSIAFSPDGTRLVSASLDGKVCVWSVEPLPGTVHDGRAVSDRWLRGPQDDLLLWLVGEQDKLKQEQRQRYDARCVWVLNEPTLIVGGACGAEWIKCYQT